MAAPRIRNTAATFDGIQHRHGGASSSSSSSSSLSSSSAPAGDAIASPAIAVASSSRPDDESSPSSSPFSSSSRKTMRARLIHLAMRLFPSVLLMAGLAIFVESFFLSRTPFELRSSCEVGSAGSLLVGALGMTDAEVSYLGEVGFLSDATAGDRGRAEGEEWDEVDRGCWTPRLVDSVVVIVVDALRFDFARDRLPLSVGSRLFPEEGGGGGGGGGRNSCDSSPVRPR